MDLKTINGNEFVRELFDHPVVVIAHGPCPDGYASHLVMRCFFDTLEHQDQAGRPIRAEYFEGRHATKMQDLPNVKDAVVFVLDFSYPKETLLKMAKDAKRLIVLDHHKSAQKELAGLEFCEFDMNRSGAQMTLDFMSRFVARYGLYAGLAMLVAYIQDRDLWRHELPDCEFVGAYLSSLSLDMHDEEGLKAWMYIADTTTSMDEVVSKGKTIRMVIKKQADDCVNRAYTGHLVGRTEHVPVVNVSPNLVSEVLNKLVLLNGAPYAIGWWYDGSKYHYSLRANGEADCSEIARRYAGGGHANAAGFTTMDDMTVTWAKDAHENRKAQRRLYGDD